MMAKLQVTPIIGLPQFNGWSQVTTNSQRSLICALAVYGQNAGNMGRDMVAAIEQAQIQSAAELHTFLQGLVDEVIQAGGKPVLSCLLAINNKSILAAYHGSILLKRGTKVGVILSSQDQLKVVEGGYVADDWLVLATAQGSSYLGEIHQKINQGYDVDTIITSLVPAIHAANNSSLISLGFVNLGQWENEPEPETVTAAGATDLPLSKLPQLEITLEAIEEAERTEEEPPVVTAAVVPEPESTQALPEGQPTPTKPKQPPISVMWTRSSKTSSFPSIFPILSKFKTALAPKVVAITNATVSTLKNVNWYQLHPKVVMEKIRNRDVYVTRQSRARMMRIGIIVVVVAVVAIGAILFWRSRQAQQVQAAEAAVQPILLEFNEARNQVSSDPVNAREKMETALAQLQALEQEFSNRPTGRRIVQQHLSAAQTVFTEVSGREEMSTLPTYFDLSQIAADWIATQIVSEADRFAVLDHGKKQVAVFNWQSKEYQTLSALEPQPVSVAINQGVVYALGGGVWQANAAAGVTEFSRAVEEGDSNREGKLLGSYSSYLYVMNPARRNIYRYTAGSDGFSDPIGWFKPGQQLAYETVHSMSIDGDIWIGTTDGQIVKLSTGEVAPFELQGMPEPFTSSLVVYTRDDFQYLYILESASRRLVVLQKTGEFIRQIKSASLAAATDIVVNESAGQALAISGSLIFQIDL